MSYKTLLYNMDRGVVRLTLNRPESLNAISYEMSVELVDAMDTIEEDPDVRVVVLTGAGRAFCAGVDIKEMAKAGYKIVPLDKRYNFLNKLEDISKPVIAAINGPCNGGGMELALCCDFLIASEPAEFGLGEVKLGGIPSGGGTVRLPRLIGASRAKELLYFGNKIDSQEAYRIGLVNKVVPSEELMIETKRWADELAERPPLALKALKYSVNVGMQMDLSGALEYETRCCASLETSEDCIEGMVAFLERRKPVFKGK